MNTVSTSRAGLGCCIARKAGTGSTKLHAQATLGLFNALRDRVQNAG